MATVQIQPAQTNEEIALARELFLEYAQGLGVDLCFQSFDQELAGLPGEYAPPTGRLFLAYAAGAAQPQKARAQLAGCGALRRIDDAACEMKRLYVRPAFRGIGLGRALATALIAAARQIGYSRMVLDTLPSMVEAHELYRILGFREIPPYRHNPIPGALFLELLLS
jgi:putative acetyltransferase